MNNASQMDEYCADKGFIGWFETSAKEDINIMDASKYLVSKVGAGLTIQVISSSTKLHTNFFKLPL